MNIKQRMEALGMSQVEMIFALQRRGVEVQPPMLSSVLRGVYTYPKARRILAECDKVLMERERQ